MGFSGSRAQCGHARRHVQLSRVYRAIGHGVLVSERQSLCHGSGVGQSQTAQSETLRMMTTTETTQAPFHSETLLPRTAATACAYATTGDENFAVVRVRPSSGWRAFDLIDLWRYRELLLFLALRDIKLRYKQTLLGVAWAVIQPLFTLAVFALFFGALAKMPSDGVPYPLFVMAALVPWQLFAYALTQSSNSLVNEQRLITKVYFPRLIVPVASVLSGLVDLGVALAVLLGLLAWYGMWPGAEIWALPLLVG